MWNIGYDFSKISAIINSYNIKLTFQNFILHIIYEIFLSAESNLHLTGTRAGSGCASASVYPYTYESRGGGWDGVGEGSYMLLAPNTDKIFTHLSYTDRLHTHKQTHTLRSAIRGAVRDSVDAV